MLSPQITKTSILGNSKALIGIQIATFVVCLLSACTSPSPDAPLFTRLTPDQTGVDFQNRIVEHEGFNVLEYEYFYNGGGVAVGDINADGLPDLYFTANMEPDQLYLNKGNLIFENITISAALSQEPGWKTGVTMADVNADGRLDIYVARSGQVSQDRRRNLLYINNGDLTFTESAAEYGLDSPAYSNHASFFDYDRDGDLDMFLLNHPIRRYSHFVVDFMKSQRDSLAGDKLFRNDGGRFVDVSEEAGIIGNPLGFGLSATVSDINQDGWPDIYVANDYIEEDYLYINQQDGMFSEEIRQWITIASYSSMGADIADIDNDGRVDILTLDMLADNHERQKILKGPDDHAYYEQMRASGYHDQAMRNMLHLRYGSTFAEIGRLAGISTTDWSWAALFADFDNDGYRDLFVSNGYMRDYTDLDFLEQILGEAREASVMGETFSSLEMVQEMPSTRLSNYIFRNNSNLRFQDKTADWQFDEPTFSNGAAYADLDADGDLDMVINNINQEAFIYRNNSERTSGNHFLRIQLLGPEGNPFGVGSKVEVTNGAMKSFQEVTPARGYLSSVDPVLHFGLGEAERVDIRVTWPDGRVSTLEDQPADQTLIIRYSESAPSIPIALAEKPVFFEEEASRKLSFVHREDDFNDFEREPLLPHMFSRLGPAAAMADVNRDGLEDIFLGGARGQVGTLYLQQLNGSFQEAIIADFGSHNLYEDLDAVFFDADSDGDPDLYVTSGGNDAPAGDPLYQDRLYINNGFGRFAYDAGRLPEMFTSTDAVAQHDFDDDGDIDIFVGGRVVPGQYPTLPRSYLLENRDGIFVDATETLVPALLHPGMIAGAAWGDLDGDAQAELLLAGEWMPLTAYQLGGSGSPIDSAAGWWNTVHLVDLDADGDLDVIAGNKGLNGSLQATAQHPVELYASDVDANGTMDAVITHALNGSRHTIYWRNELIRQIPRWETIFPTQTDYARATYEDIRKNIPPDALVLKASNFATKIYENLGSGEFRSVPLPIEVQFVPVQSILTADVNQDGQMDVILAGNNFATRAEWGRDNAGKGLLLLGKGGMVFDPVPMDQVGASLDGDVREIRLISVPGGSRLLALYNDGPAKEFTFIANPPIP